VINFCRDNLGFAQIWRRAFTLVELLASLAIATFLIVALLAVSVRLSRTSYFKKATQQQLQKNTALFPLLVTDVRHAIQCKSNADGFSLKTYNSLDSSTLERRHRLTEVYYTILTIDDQMWLLRRQETPMLVQLICNDIVQWEVSSDDKDWPIGDQWTSLPLALTIDLTFRGPDTNTSITRKVTCHP
jgi:hypothetical protein